MEGMNKILDETKNNFELYMQIKNAAQLNSNQMTEALRGSKNIKLFQDN